MSTRLGIRKQLIFAFSTVLIFLVIISGAGIASIYSLSEEIATLTSNELADGARIGRAQWGIWELRFGLANYIAIPDPQARAKIKQDSDKWIKVVRENMEAFAKSNRTAEEKRLLSE